MKGALFVIPLFLLTACSGPVSPSTASTPSASTPSISTASTTPSRAPTTRTFTAQEEALLANTGWSKADPNAGAYIDSAHNLCATFSTSSDEEIVQALKQTPADKLKDAGPILTLFCDDSSRYMPLMIAAQTDGSFVSGLYYVGAGADEIKPGEYRTIGAVQNCYWERTSKSGDILANDLVSNAPGGVRVVVKPSDYQVKFQNCGVWVPKQG